MREEIYNSSVKFKGKFDIYKFYKDLKRYIYEELGWMGIFGEDRFETYYYQKVSPEGLVSIEFNWSGNMNFWKEEPKINWYLNITGIINNYSIQTQTGEIEVKIKGEHEIEDVKEPEVKSFSEKILSSLGISKVLLKKSFEKVRIEGSNIKDKSAANLYKTCDGLKEWISKYFNLY